MGYTQYGIERELVERIKRRMKDPEVKERVKPMLEGLTKEDLQNRAKVEKLLAQGAKSAGIALTPRQAEAIVTFVMDLRIDPNNTFHLLKLWAMFR